MGNLWFTYYTQTFEPMLHHLLEMAEKDSSYRIDEIWTYDAVQHGDSGLINAAQLGSLCESHILIRKIH